MEKVPIRVGPIEPKIYKASGGWLAVSPAGSDLKIGVAGNSENEVRREFAGALKRWQAILDDSEQGQPNRRC